MLDIDEATGFIKDLNTEFGWPIPHQEEIVKGFNEADSNSNGFVDV